VMCKPSEFNAFLFGFLSIEDATLNVLIPQKCIVNQEVVKS